MKQHIRAMKRSIASCCVASHSVSPFLQKTTLRVLRVSPKAIARAFKYTLSVHICAYLCSRRRLKRQRQIRVCDTQIGVCLCYSLLADSVDGSGSGADSGGGGASKSATRCCTIGICSRERFGSVMKITSPFFLCS